MKIEIPNKKILLVANIIFLCIIAGMMVFSAQKTDNSDGVITRDANNEYKLTNPILDYEDLSSGNNSAIPVGLINNKIDDLKEQSGLSHISLYYRDLNNGQWIGIEEKEEFYPASLLKVPTMMAFLKSIESEIEVLNERKVIDIKDDIKVEQNVSFLATVIVGEEYSYLEILDSMITKSDNIAAQTILNNTDTKEIKNVFSSVGAPFVDTKTEPIIRVKDYAGFFRVLYNASYLNREMSELALEILSISEYKKGLVAGVPPTITVAHKFGERSIVAENNGNQEVEQVQLHDCGIIYYPKKPYILCIMTLGKDFKVQEVAIQELSKFVYDQISK